MNAYTIASGSSELVLQLLIQYWYDTIVEHKNVERTYFITHTFIALTLLVGQQEGLSGSGVVSGTTVRALVLGRFSQKRNKK